MFMMKRMATIAIFAAALAFWACSNSSSPPVANVPQDTNPQAADTGRTSQTDPATQTAQEKPLQGPFPLTLEAVSGAATVTFKNEAAGPVTYKINGGAAQTIASKTEKAIELSKAGDRVYFYGENSTYASYDLKNSAYVFNSYIDCSTDCYVYGNVMSLVAGENFDDAKKLSGDSAFCGLFKENKRVKNKDGEELLLPATELTAACYLAMFLRCEGLTSAPALPAQTLADSCYKEMFKECKGLKTVSELSAVTLADYSCESMFRGCESLVEAPAILAETLSYYSCYFMFADCKALKKAPEKLPAKTLAQQCYESMFDGCESLEKAPEILAETMGPASCLYMFENCKSLAQVPDLKAKTLNDDCCRRMFNGCSALAKAPYLPAEQMKKRCCEEMFMNSENLT